MSVPKLKEKYPTGKIPRSSEDNGKTFICRRGVTARTATYTDEFIWEDVYRDVDDIEPLKDRVVSETQATRGHKATTIAKPKDLDFVVVDDEDKENEPRTPKKRRKLEPGTPKSAQDRTPSKLRTPTSKRHDSLSLSCTRCSSNKTAGSSPKSLSSSPPSVPVYSTQLTSPRHLTR